MFYILFGSSGVGVKPLKLGRIRNRIALAFVAFLTACASVVGSAHASTSAGDMTSTITEWLPIILEFAIIGMIFGMLKKFGGGR